MRPRLSARGAGQLGEQALDALAELVAGSGAASAPCPAESSRTQSLLLGCGDVVVGAAMMDQDDSLPGLCHGAHDDTVAFGGSNHTLSAVRKGGRRGMPSRSGIVSARSRDAQFQLQWALPKTRNPRWQPGALTGLLTSGYPVYRAGNACR